MSIRLLAPMRLLLGWLLVAGATALPSPATAEPFAYVAVRDSNQVSVIDTAVNTVAATIPVAGGPYGVALTPDGSRAYVSSFFGHTVTVIDTATNTVIATIPVGSNP